VTYWVVPPREAIYILFGYDMELRHLRYFIAVAEAKK
jgi:hypothetical protein